MRSRERRRPWRESDRVVGALRPGNAGGAKGPDFWCAFEDGEVVVIGDKPENTIEDRRRPRLLCRGAKESCSPCRSRVRLGLLPVCLTVKPVGEPDALIGHVRFDKRGGETERCRMAQATAPILDSTIASFRCAAKFGRYWSHSGHRTGIAHPHALGKMRANGVRTLAAWCLGRGCNHFRIRCPR